MQGQPPARPGPARKTSATVTCAPLPSRAEQGAPCAGAERPRPSSLTSVFLWLPSPPPRRLRRLLSFLLPPAPSADGGCHRRRCARARGEPRSRPPRPGRAPRRRGALGGACVTSGPGEAGGAGRGRGRAGEGGSQRRLRGPAASAGARRGPAAPASHRHQQRETGAGSATGPGECGRLGGYRQDGRAATNPAGPGSAHPGTSSGTAGRLGRVLRARVADVLPGGCGPSRSAVGERSGAAPAPFARRAGPASPAGRAPRNRPRRQRLPGAETRSRAGGGSGGGTGSGCPKAMRADLPSRLRGLPPGRERRDRHRQRENGGARLPRGHRGGVGPARNPLSFESQRPRASGGKPPAKITDRSISGGVILARRLQFFGDCGFLIFFLKKTVIDAYKEKKNNLALLSAPCSCSEQVAAERARPRRKARSHGWCVCGGCGPAEVRSYLNLSTRRRGNGKASGVAFVCVAELETIGKLSTWPRAVMCLATKIKRIRRG